MKATHTAWKMKSASRNADSASNVAVTVWLANRATKCHLRHTETAKLGRNKTNRHGSGMESAKAFKDTHLWKQQIALVVRVDVMGIDLLGNCFLAHDEHGLRSK
jgi:hypothetical protein